MTTSNDQLSGWTEKKLRSTSQNQTCTKTKADCHWRSAASLIQYSFLNPGKTITSEKNAQQINEMNPKLKHLQPASKRVNKKGPVILHNNAPLHLTQPALQRLNKLGYEVLPHCHIHLTFHQSTTTSSSILTIFCRENASTTSRMQKMLSMSSLNPETWIFQFSSVAESCPTL